MRNYTRKNVEKDMVRKSQGKVLASKRDIEEGNFHTCNGCGDQVVYTRDGYCQECAKEEEK